MRTLCGIIGAVVGIAIGMLVHPQPTMIDALFPMAGAWLGASIGHALAS